jgi:hypothetical protein
MELHSELLAEPKSLKLLPQIRAHWVRVALAAAAGLLFVTMALAHDEPVVMLVGLAPLALLTAEGVWRLFDRTEPD